MKWRKRDRSAVTEATQAREQAQRALEATQAQTPRFEALGESLRQIRERNHLTELFLAMHNGKD